MGDLNYFHGNGKVPLVTILAGGWGQGGAWGRGPGGGAEIKVLGFSQS